MGDGRWIGREGTQRAQRDEPLTPALSPTLSPSPASIRLRRGRDGEREKGQRARLQASMRSLRSFAAILHSKFSTRSMIGLLRITGSCPIFFSAVLTAPLGAS